MREPQQQTLQIDEEATLGVRDEETTLVAPRFDEEETLVARPVVPLGADAHAPAPAQTPARPAPEARRTFAPRRSGILALALASILIGGVLGGAGLYLYQRQSQDPAVSPAAMAPEPLAAPADAAQAPDVSAESQPAAPHAEPPAPQTEAPSAASNAAKPATPAPDAEVPAASPARKPESVSVAERRTAPSEGTPRRIKKDERDEEIERRPAPRPDDNLARDEAPEARRVDTIFYRQRRAERQAERRAARRARRNDDVDRLRRIFEGTP